MTARMQGGDGRQGCAAAVGGQRAGRAGRGGMGDSTEAKWRPGTGACSSRGSMQQLGRTAWQVGEGTGVQHRHQLVDLCSERAGQEGGAWVTARIQGGDPGQGRAAAGVQHRPPVIDLCRGRAEQGWKSECGSAAPPPAWSACRVQHAVAGRRVHTLICPPHFLSHFPTLHFTLSHTFSHTFTLLCRTLVDDTHWSPPAAAPPAPAPAVPPAPSAPPSPCACSRAATVKTSLLRRTWEQVVQGKSSSCAPAPSCPAMHCGEMHAGKGGVVREGWQGKQRRSAAAEHKWC